MRILGLNTPSWKKLLFSALAMETREEYHTDKEELANETEWFDGFLYFYLFLYVLCFGFTFNFLLFYLEMYLENTHQFPYFK